MVNLFYAGFPAIGDVPDGLIEVQLVGSSLPLRDLQKVGKPHEVEAEHGQQGSWYVEARYDFVSTAAKVDDAVSNQVRSPGEGEFTPSVVGQLDPRVRHHLSRVHGVASVHRDT